MKEVSWTTKTGETTRLLVDEIIEHQIAIVRERLAAAKAAGALVDWRTQDVAVSSPGDVLARVSRLPF